MAKREEQPNRWVLIVMIALSVALALSGRGVARRVRSVTPYILGPLADAGMYVTTVFRGSFHGDEDVPADVESAAMIRYWKATAEAYQQQLDALTQPQEGFSPITDLSIELIPARVCAGDALPYGRTRQVSAGRRHGATEGDQVTTRLLLTNRAKALEPHNKLAVVTRTALVGRLGETGAYTARLILVTDRAFRMEAQILRDETIPRQIRVDRPGNVRVEWISRENNASIDCVAEGNGSDAVIVNGVSKDDAVLVGDELAVRVFGTYHWTHVLIGEVVETIDDPELGAGFSQLRIKPAVDLASLRYVFILAPILGLGEDGR